MVSHRFPFFSWQARPCRLNQQPQSRERLYRAGAKLIFINRTETPYDQLASILFRENTGEVLGEIVEGLKG
jgi:NAD-dependent SIR2 family protein deacetylase